MNKQGELPASRPIAILIESSGGGQERVTIPVGKSFVFGRDATADHAVNDLKMSRNHFRIVSSARSWMVLDLASSNGTQLNRIEVTENALKDGDIIQAGETLFRVSLASDGNNPQSETNPPAWQVSETMDNIDVL